MKLTRRDFLKKAGLGAAGVTAMGLLASCGGDGGNGGNGSEGSNGEEGGSTAGSITDLVLFSTTELSSWDPFYQNSATALRICANIFDSLLTHDLYGNLVPCLAESWGTEDNGKTWTFHLRKDAVWVDKDGNEMAKVTSADWVTALEWVLNYWASEGHNSALITDTVEGALEYYEYTYNLDEETAMGEVDYDKFMETVGIETPDEYTIIYHCKNEIVYFDTLSAYIVLYGLPRGLLDTLGREGYKSCTGTQLWFNGPYMVTSFTRDNEKVMTKNPLWWNTEANRFETITVRKVDSTDTAYLMFHNDEFDMIELTESNIRSIADDPSHEYYDNLVIEHTATFAGKITFNFAKNLEDGTPDVNWNTAIANENFRKALYYGVDWTDYLGRQNALKPLESQGYTIVSPNLCHIDGQDYCEYVEGLLGLDSDAEEFDRYDAAKGQEYKEKAMEELSAQGVTFPVEMVYYIQSSNQTSLDTANVVKNNLEEYLGDMVTLTIKTYITSFANEVRTPSYEGITISGWAPDYGDPIAVLGLACNDVPDMNFSRSAHIYDATTEIVDVFNEFTSMVRAADAIHDDLNARYKAFAEAEVFAIENVMFLPLYTTSFVELTRINDFTHALAGYGIQEYKFVDVETSTELYTQEQWDEFEAEYEANRH